MSENKIKEQVWREIEAEAEALERKVEENEELASLEMPEGSFDDLMARIKAAENEKSNVKPLRIRKRALLAVALVAVLLVAASVGTSGAKLFVPKVENRGEGGELSIDIDNDDNFVVEYTEDEAYEAIEEALGILALRLGYKPKGMELQSGFVDAEMGEAQMEFYYEDHILTVYENKQSNSASTGTQPDGICLDTIELFYLDQTIEIVEIDKGNSEVYYRSEFEYGNAYYCVTCDIELDEFKNILMGIIFDTM